MEEKSITKSPRLYTELDLKSGSPIALEGPQVHYLKNVLRKKEDDPLRLFNGRDGEWVGRIETIGKKDMQVALIEQRRPQSANTRRIHAYFAPIKKNRMDFLIEKAVELGATDLHPVITQNTENRKLNAERIELQIIEAAEQCERLTLPTLHKPADLFQAIKSVNAPVLAALERGDHPLAIDIRGQFINQDIGILIGPEGGFTAEEMEWLAARENITAVSLGSNILRAETALVKFLSVL